MKKIVAYSDGGARGNPGPAGAGAVVLDGDGNVLAEVMQYLGNGTNNFAEYHGVILALSTIRDMFGKQAREMDIEVRMDSELVQKQLSGLYQIKEPSLVPQFLQVHNMCVTHFPRITFTHVRREENKRADELANQAMDSK